MKRCGKLFWALVWLFTLLAPAAMAMSRWPAEIPATFTEVRARKLLAQMTLSEKIDQMHGEGDIHGLFPSTYSWGTHDTPDNERLGIPGLHFTDGPRGVNQGRSTAFPASIARAASFDTELERRIGRAMGLEARHQGANSMGAICIETVRHPGWGRTQESFGADPFLAGEMGVALYQGLGENVMPIVKHFAMNSIENTRFSVNVTVDERTLREVYLPQFKKVVDAGVPGVMSAYNKVNGLYCAENPLLLTDILRQGWGFEGFVVSDWFFGTRSTAPSLSAGLDIEMPVPFYYSESALRRALDRGEITPDQIDRAVLRILKQKIRFGLLDEDGFTPEPGTVVACPRHIGLALESARKSIVLLKNDAGALPLERGKVKKIVVIGDLARQANLGSPGSAGVNPPYAVAPLEGIRNHAGPVQVVYASGAPIWRGYAKRLAEKADAAIVVAGLSGRDEGEYYPFMGGGDRERLELPGSQTALIRDIASVSRRCIVVLEGGSAIAAGDWAGQVEAVLMAWYPGMEGGNAIGQVLFGDVNPGGRLPLTFPDATVQLPPFDCESLEVTYDYLHDYRYLDYHGIGVSFPFGHGLSYTEFAYDRLKIGRTPDTIEVSMAVTNTGAVAGTEVVQLYVGYENSAVFPRSVKELKGFARIDLAPGQTRTVTLSIPVSELAYYDDTLDRWVIEDMAYGIYVGASAQDIRLRGGFELPM